MPSLKAVRKEYIELKIEFYNLPNSDKQIKWDTTLTASAPTAGLKACTTFKLKVQSKTL
jgi:hypothetical protein